eukprot:5926687-Pleurochrysis_carterae.AAC.4
MVSAARDRVKLQAARRAMHRPKRFVSCVSCVHSNTVICVQDRMEKHVGWQSCRCKSSSF